MVMLDTERASATSFTLSSRDSLITAGTTWEASKATLGDRDNK